jgi:hypothetical protein
MGLTQDRRTFLLVAVDGRSTRSAGMYGTELARLMELLGAYQAFNLDGGGSTTFWQRGVGVRNRPSDGAERPVANHWGIFAGSSNGRPRAPGSCYALPPAPMDAGVRDAATDVPRDVPRDVPMDVPRDVPMDVPRDVMAFRDVRVDATRDVVVPAEDIPTEDVSTEDVSTEDVSAEDVSTEDVSTEDVSTEDAPEFVDATREEMPDAGDAPDTAEAPEGCSCRAVTPRGGLSALALVALSCVRRRRRR